ncbi:hypothetical protein ACFL57_00760 [Candidatus Margulisiibacteriota bacterium]
MQKKIIVDDNNLYPNKHEIISDIFDHCIISNNPIDRVLKAVSDMPHIIEIDETGAIFALLGQHAIHDKNLNVRLKALGILLQDNDGIRIIEDILTHEDQSLPNNLLTDIWLIEDKIIDRQIRKEYINLRDLKSNQLWQIKDGSLSFTQQPNPNLSLLTELFSIHERIKLLNSILEQIPRAVDRVSSQMRRVHKALNSGRYKGQSIGIIKLKKMMDGLMYADESNLKAAYRHLLTMSESSKASLADLLLDTEGIAFSFPSPVGRLLMTIGSDEKIALAYYLFHEMPFDRGAKLKLANIGVNRREDADFLDYLFEIFQDERSIEYKGTKKEGLRPPESLRAVCWYILDREQELVGFDNKHWKQAYKDFLEWNSF